MTRGPITRLLLARIQKEFNENVFEKKKLIQSNNWWGWVKIVNTNEIVKIFLVFFLFSFYNSYTKSTWIYTPDYYFESKSDLVPTIIASK